VALVAAVNVPPQVFVELGVPVTFRPEGKPSLNPTLLNDTAFGFAIVKFNWTLPLSGTVDPPNALLIVGGATTVNVAVLLVVPGPPSFELRTPVVLACAPLVMPFTVTDKAQVPPDATVPPLKLTEVALAAALNVPPQVLVAPGVLAT
jgi:hypothetical protein